MARAEQQSALVVGAGSWGTALAMLLARRGRPVTLWCRDPEQARVINQQHHNPRYLSSFRLPEGIEAVSGDAPEMPARPCMMILAVPAQKLRSALDGLAGRLPLEVPRVSAAKGLERFRLARVSEVVQELLGAGGSEVVLSGPSFAEEVARGCPTAVTVASADAEAARAVQSALASPSFRVYTSGDVVGVELAGALKNVVAIAAGIVDGLELGRNALAGLITRGLAEMTRLGVAMGGRAETFLGLAGVGDLVLTATSDLSRNRRVGLQIGRGRRLEQILSEMSMVAEGVETSVGILELGPRHGVDLPVTQAVKEILFDGKPPRQAVWELMTRQLKAED
jgi:glycerol-3-phosphate dehydrogenase (NAD(P)+)